MENIRRVGNSTIYVLMVLLLWGVMSFSYAEEVVKVGVIYPLTGGLKATGDELKNAIEMTADIVNNKHPELAPLLLAESGGVKIRRGGKIVNAKIAIEWGNSEGKVENGAAEVTRLVRDKRVVAILGTWQSAVTRAAATTAAREQVPLLTQSVALDLTDPNVMGESLKWFFRPNPSTDDFMEGFLKFLDGVREKKKIEIKRIGIFFENTLCGQQNTDTTLDLIKKKYKHYEVVAKIGYPHETSDVVAESLSLKRANPDVAFNACPYISDSILFTSTFKEVDFNPKAYYWEDAGISSPGYLENVKKNAEYFFTRMIYNADFRGRKPLIGKIDDLFYKRYKMHMGDNSARAMLKALVLFDAINRAQSDNPDDIRKALLATDIPEQKTNMIFGVKFDPVTHQNILTAGKPAVGQILNGEFRTVFPWNFATTELVWPTPPWRERK